METTSFGTNNQLDSERYKDAIGRFTSGVSIITVRENGIDYGITASAVCSVSTEPPMLLVCANQKTGTSHAISKVGSFTVNILAEHQGEQAIQFARPNTDKFQDIDIHYGALGNPVLTDTLAQLECEVTEEVTGGTHSIFIGKVQSVSVVEEDPLVYFRGKFGKYVRTLRE